jgi:branched-chain amino acid transport system permease protein
MIQRFKPWATPVGLVALLLVAIAFPFLISDPTLLVVAFTALVFATFASGWNIFSGYTGYIALGHTAYFGIGAYALAIICKHFGTPPGWQPFEFIPICGLIAGVFAIPLGAIALRTRRHTFVVITIATFFVVQLLAVNNVLGLTNGTQGLNFALPFQWYGPQDGLPFDEFLQIHFYYPALALAIIALVVSWLVRSSKYGLGLLAIRDDEDRAQGLGVKTEIFKLSAFVISAIFAGMAGALYGYHEFSVSPFFAFNTIYDISVALMVFLGGVGTLSGPILGALVLESVQLYLGANLTAGNGGVKLILFGGLFLVVILLLPQGVVPSLRNLWARWQARGQVVTAEKDPTPSPMVPMAQREEART